MPELPPRTRLFGEDWPLAVPLGLLFLGGMSAVAAERLWHRETHAVAASLSPSLASRPSATALPSSAGLPAPDATAMGAVSGPAQPVAAALPKPGPSVATSPPSEPKLVVPRARAGDSADCAPVFSVGFVAGGSRLKSPITAQVERLSRWLQAHPQARLSIDGYSDQLGSIAGRFAISQRRAQAVAAELQRAGVPKSQLNVRAFGHYIPSASAGSLPDDRRIVLLRVDGVPDCQEERSAEP